MQISRERAAALARALAPALIPGLVYLAVAVAATWEVWRARMALIGGGDQPDWTGTMWTYWWVARALQEGLNPFHGSWNFYPVGISAVAQYNILDALLAAPLFILFGPITGYNAAAVLALASSALAMDRLARGAGASPWGALVAGLGLELSTYVSMELYEGRLSQVLLGPLLIATLRLYQLSRGQLSPRQAVGAGAWTALTFLGYWYYGLFLVFGAVPLFLAEIRRLDRARLRALGLAALTTTLLSGPFVLSLLRAYDGLPGVQRPMDTALFDYGVYGRDQFGLNMAINQSLWPGFPLMGSTSPPDDHRIALALLVLGLGGLVLRQPGRAPWIGMAVLGWVLALGPYARDQAGQPHPWKLPYLYLYDWTPLVSRLWWPERFAILCWIGLCVLAALHLDRLRELLARRARPLVPVLLALTVAGLGWDAWYRNTYMPPFAEPGRPVTIAVYSRLNGPILTVPVLGNDPSSRYLLWFQVFHNQPILSGLGAHLEGHRPPGYEAYIRHNRLLAALAAASEGGPGGQIIQPEDIAALREDGFVWAMVDPMAFSGFYRAEMIRVFNEIFFTLWGQSDVPRGATAAWRISPIKKAVQLPDRPPRTFSYSREMETKTPKVPGAPGTLTPNQPESSPVLNSKGDKRRPRHRPGPFGERQDEPVGGGQEPVEDVPAE